MNPVNTTIVDAESGGGHEVLEIAEMNSGEGVEIHLHNDADCDELIAAVQIYNGELRVLVWHIGEEEPVTHVLKKARRNHERTNGITHKHS